MYIRNDYETARILQNFIDKKFIYVPKVKINETGGSYMDYFYDDGYDDFDNPTRTIRKCFSILYHDGQLLNAIYSNLVEYDGFAEDGCYWYYPDLNGPDESLWFDGVRFEVGFSDPDWTVTVTEKECFEYTKAACERFLEIHPEENYRRFLYDILDNWEPLNKD